MVYHWSSEGRLYCLLPASALPLPLSPLPGESNFHVLVSTLLNLSAMAQESSLTPVDGNHLVMNLVPTSFSCSVTPSLTKANSWCCSLFLSYHVLQALAALETGVFPSSIPTQALSHCCIFVTVIQGPSRITGTWAGGEQMCQG